MLYATWPSIGVQRLGTHALSHMAFYWGAKAWYKCVQPHGLLLLGCCKHRVRLVFFGVHHFHGMRECSPIVLAIGKVCDLERGCRDTSFEDKVAKNITFAVNKEVVEEIEVAFLAVACRDLVQRTFVYQHGASLWKLGSDPVAYEVLYHR